MSSFIVSLNGATAWMDRFGIRGGLRLIGALRRLTYNSEPVPIPLDGYRSPVWLRPHTKDVDVFSQVFRAEQYALDAADGNPKVILDCGAHIGCSAVYFAHQYPQARIIAVEAQRANYELLLRNTEAYPNVRCVHGAVWPRSESVQIENSDVDTWAFRVTRGGDLRGYTIAELMAENRLDHIDILKLDIEGAEQGILSAPDAREWLDRTTIIMAELHDHFVPGCSRALYKLLEPYRWRQSVNHEIVTITVSD